MRAVIASNLTFKYLLSGKSIVIRIILDYLYELHDQRLDSYDVHFVNNPLLTFAISMLFIFCSLTIQGSCCKKETSSNVIHLMLNDLI